MHNRIYPELEELWVRIRGSSFQGAERIDVRRNLADAESSCRRTADVALQPWIGILEESLHCLYHLYGLMSEQQARGDGHPPAAMLLVGRSCSMVAAVRRLVISGFEDASRPVARSLLEGLDLALVTLVDTEFGEAFTGDDNGYDEDEFWRAQIAYGRIHRRVEGILVAAGLSQEDTREIIGAKKYLRRALSGSAHSSLNSALAASFVPSLIRPGLLSPSIWGHISLNSPRLLNAIIQEILVFVRLVAGQLISDTPPPLFQTVDRESPKLVSALVALLTFQEIVERHEAVLLTQPELPPDADAPGA